MRAFGHSYIIGMLALTLSDLSAQNSDATRILAATREALGGDKRLSAVRSFVASGRTRQVRGDNLVPIEFEISCELPDKCIRRDEIPAQESGPTTIGFNGAALIQLPVPLVSAFPAHAGGPPAPCPAQLGAARNARVTTVKTGFRASHARHVRRVIQQLPAHVLVRRRGRSPTGEGRRHRGQCIGRDASRSVAPPAPPPPDSTGPPPSGSDGARGRGGVPAPANFVARFFVHKDTHLPIMVSWQGPVQNVQGKPVELRRCVFRRRRLRSAVR